MDGAPGKFARICQAETVATVVYSARSLAIIERIFEFLRAENPAAAVAAATAIQTAVDHLSLHPLIGRRIEGEILRRALISWANRLADRRDRFNVLQDEVRILALRHQRELGFQPSRTREFPQLAGIGAWALKCRGFTR